MVLSIIAAGDGSINLESIFHFSDRFFSGEFELVFFDKSSILFLS